MNLHYGRCVLFQVNMFLWRRLHFHAIEQILWLVFALAWGTSHLFYTRAFASDA